MPLSLLNSIPIKFTLVINEPSNPIYTSIRHTYSVFFCQKEEAIYHVHARNQFLSTAPSFKTDEYYNYVGPSKKVGVGSFR